MSNNCFKIGCTIGCNRECSWRIGRETHIKTKYYIEDDNFHCAYCHYKITLQQNFTINSQWYSAYCACVGTKLELRIQKNNEAMRKILAYKPLSEDLGFICLLSIL